MRDEVLIEVHERGPGGRQIGPESRLLQSIGERRSDIESVIAIGTDIATAGMAKETRDQVWGVESVELTFGISLTAEAGVLVSKASAEASLEVTITVARRGATA